MPVSRRDSLRAIQEARRKNPPAKCAVCKKADASATCKTCGQKVCAKCYDYTDEVVTCHSCKVPAVTCPKCKSSQIQVMKQGFSGGAAVVGALYAGTLGAVLTGGLNAGDVQVACARCGHTWKPRL